MIDRIFSSGASAAMHKNPGKPALAPYADMDAPPLPEDVPIHPRLCRRSASVIVAAAIRSLYEPVGFIHSALPHISDTPNSRASDVNGSTGVLPSPSDTFVAFVTI